MYISHKPDTFYKAETAFRTFSKFLAEKKMIKTRKQL